LPRSSDRSFPAATVAKAGQLGFLGIEVPERYGGSGLEALCFVLAMEEIAAADEAHATVVSVNDIPLGQFEELRRSAFRARSGCDRARQLLDAHESTYVCSPSALDELNV